jgi:hypothetical protein
LPSNIFYDKILLLGQKSLKIKTKIANMNNVVNLSQIIKLAASTENTPELQSYWEKRYQDLLDRQLFKISEKTIALLADKEQITKPATPFGDIVLVNHLDKNQALDELILQSTLESSVRLLDSLVDKIQFTPSAKFIVAQYRKIGLGLFDFQEYLGSRKSSSDLDEIDYVGSLVSNGSYRASESLAEEKGVCLNWSKVHKHLRPKSFEYWYQLDSADVKTGLEMSEDFDQDSILASNFEIIPRRNSNILLFPIDLEWQIWSDRDSTAAKTEISHLDTTADEPTTAKKIEVEMTDSEPAENTSALPLPTQSSITTDQMTDTIPEITEITELPLVVPESPTELLNISTEDHELLVETPYERDLVPIDSPDTLAELEQSIHQHLKEQEIVNQAAAPAPTTPLFQIGELVTVQSESQPEYKDKVYQIIDCAVGQMEGASMVSYHYKLTGDNLSVEEFVWDEKDLIPVELNDILAKINHPIVALDEVKVEIQESIQPYVHALITKDDKILLETINNNLELPGGNLPKNIIPEVSIENLMFEKYGIIGKAVYEIGSSLTKSDNDLPSRLHLGYIFETDKVANPDLRWYEKKELARASKYVLAILAKQELQKSYFKDKYPPTPQPNQGRAQIEVTETQSKPTKNTPLEISKNPQIKTNLNMAKYILKLEQLLQTEAFGNIRVSLEYDAKGARLVSLKGDKVSPELETLLSTVLNLVNFSLGKNTQPTELAKLLEFQTQTPGPLSNLLKIVSEVLISAPGTVAEITPDLIVDILPLENYTKSLS